jgi:hypothetical protein
MNYARNLPTAAVSKFELEMRRTERSWNDLNAAFHLLIEVIRRRDLSVSI